MGVIWLFLPQGVCLHADCEKSSRSLINFILLCVDLFLAYIVLASIYLGRKGRLVCADLLLCQSLVHARDRI